MKLSTQNNPGIRHILIRYWYLILSGIVVLLAINLTGYILLQNEKAGLLLKQDAIRNEEIAIIDFELNGVIENSVNITNIIMNANETQGYVTTPTEPNLEAARQLFYRIETNERACIKIVLVDTDGAEIAGVVKHGDVIEILGDSALGSIAGTNLFMDTSALAEGKIYVSDLDLEQDDGVTIVPYVPSIRLVAPIFADGGTKLGSLVVTFDVSEVLRFFNEAIGDSYSYTEFGLLSHDVLFQFRYDAETDEYVLDYKSMENDELESDAVIMTDPYLSQELQSIIARDTPFAVIFLRSDVDSLFREEGSFFLNNQWLLFAINLLALVSFYLITVEIGKRQSDKSLLGGVMELADKQDNAVVITDYRKKVLYINEAFVHLFGYSLSEMKNGDPARIIETEHDDKFDSVGKGSDTYGALVWIRTKSGIYMLSHYSLRAVYHFSGLIEYYIGEYSLPYPYLDVVSEGETEGSEIFSPAKTAIFAKPLATRPIAAAKTAVLLIRISNLINNRFFDYVKYSRIGLYNHMYAALGADFTILVPDRGYFLIAGEFDFDEKSEDDHIHQIMEVIENYLIPIVGDNYKRYQISMDRFHKADDTYREIIAHLLYADEFLTKKGVERFNVFQEQMIATVQRDHLIESQLDYAFARDEFYMNYQIQKSLGEDAITGVEALLRWESHLLGNVPPNDFIAKIESSQHINALTKMVVTKVIADLSPYADRFPNRFKIAVNLTTYDFRHKTVMKEIVSLIEASPLSTGLFCFEITENDYLDNLNDANEIIRYLHSKGIVVAIDDFGKGYSFLGVLRGLNIDKVKIDRMFIKDYPEKDDGSVFRTIVNLAKDMGLILLAEGVETTLQAEFARSVGVDKYQGYLLSLPLGIDQLIATFFSR